jgi:hypothetical protein
MTFKLEKDDPENPGRSIPAGIAIYTYHRAAEVDWTSKESVTRLNGWRQGNFIRQIGPKQKTRELWLESERDQLIQILEQHLSTRVVRGRWKGIDWLDIEGRYNAIMKGTMQNVGELTAKRMYSVGKKQKATSESRPIKKARIAPERSAAALRNQIEQFADDRARQLVRDAKNKDAEELAEGLEDDEQVAEAVSDWEVPSDNESGEPKRPRKTKGKKVDTAEVGSSIKEVDETVDERFERRPQETLERTRHQKPEDHDDNNGGPSSSSSSRAVSISSRV